MLAVTDADADAGAEVLPVQVLPLWVRRDVTARNDVTVAVPSEPVVVPPVDKEALRAELVEDPEEYESDESDELDAYEEEAESVE